MMNNYLKLIVLTVFSMFLSACDISKSPSQVTEQFWQALLSKNTEQAKLLSTNDTYALLETMQELPNDITIAVGDEKIIDDKAHVVTIFTWKTPSNSDKNESDLEQTVQLQTTLVKVDKQWKVDVDQTMTAFIAAPFGQSFDEIKEELGKTFEQGAKLFKDFMQEGVKEFGKALNEGLQELNKQMQEMLEQWREELDQEKGETQEEGDMI